MRSEAFGSRFCVRRGKCSLSATRAMQIANPEGGVHGCPPFFDRARMASRKIPEQVTCRVSSVGEAVFFGSVSFGPAKEMNPLAARRVEALDSARLAEGADRGEDQTLSSADAAEFISFGRRQKKRNQRKTSPRSQRHDESFAPGFFDSPSLARSKNAAHPCAAPYGSAPCIDHSMQSQSQSQSQSDCALYRRNRRRVAACTQ